MARNRKLDVGGRYMQRTFHGAIDLIAQEGQGEEGQPDEPTKFKLYKDVARFRLPQSLPSTLGDARWSFETFRKIGQPAPFCGKLTDEILSALLYFTYGFARHEVGPGVRWPFHRVVPSARCFFPTELYVWIPQLEHLPAGLYHYDNLHHTLSALRLGDFRREFGRITGADLTGACCVLVVSSLFWKNAFRYRNYSYRLCTQEAGVVVGNALMTGGTLGLQGHVHYQFLDRPLNRLLGFECFEESAFATVPLYPWRGVDGQAPAPTSEILCEGELLDEISPITPKHLKTGSFDRKLCDLLTEVDQNSLLESTDEIATESAGGCDEPEYADRAKAYKPPPPAAGRPTELAGALRSRDSGGGAFAPLAIPLEEEAFWEIIRYATDPYACDLRGAGDRPFLRLYVVANNVRGIPKGVYRFCGDQNALYFVERRDVSMSLQAVSYAPSNVNSHSSNMVVYVVGDYPAISGTFGNRGYRIMNVEGGIIAHRVCTMSAAQGLSARISNSYDPARSEVLLGLVGSTSTPIFQITIGKKLPGPQYGLRIRF